MEQNTYDEVKDILNPLVVDTDFILNDKLIMNERIYLSILRRVKNETTAIKLMKDLGFSKMGVTKMRKSINTKDPNLISNCMNESEDISPEDMKLMTIDIVKNKNSDADQLVNRCE